MAFGPKRRAIKQERCAMADVVYLLIGLAIFGLMTLYAYACDRL